MGYEHALWIQNTFLWGNIWTIESHHVIYYIHLLNLVIFFGINDTNKL